MLLRTIVLLGLFAPATVMAQGRRDPTVIGKIDSVWSKTLKENRRYLVYTPPSYNDTTYTPQRYPVLYLLDGDAHFHSVSGLVQILGTGVNGTYVVPEMMVVAIPNTDRTRDMTPTNVQVGLDGKPNPFFKTSGGMGNFFTFLKDELIPEIDSKYRTSGYRIFVGHSLGGITAINALYSIPETFNAYVAIDPSLWWDKKVLLGKAKDYFSAAKLDNRVLYIGQANTINPDDSTNNDHFNAIVQFNSVLEAYNKSGLRYAYKYYADDDHGSVPLISEYEALRFIFDGYRVPLMPVMKNPPELVAHFDRVSAKLGAPFKPTEAMVTQLAQFNLMGGQDTANAVAFYEMGTRLFPNSYRSFDRLGAIYAARKETAKARQYYEKSLALRPDNKAAQEALRKLGQ